MAKKHRPATELRMTVFQMSRKEYTRSRGTYQTNEEATDGGIPRCERLQARGERQGLAVDSLGLHASMEPNVCEGDAKPGQKTRDGGHIGEPVEHLARA
jgi:hypothetical protein